MSENDGFNVVASKIRQQLMAGDPSHQSCGGEEELYPCPHCGTPTKGGRVIGMIGKKVVREMCQGCEDYIGSPAAQQEGATMNNRFEMERKYKAEQARKELTDANKN